MTGWDAFNKYVGVQGVLAGILFSGYVASMFFPVVLPHQYETFTGMVLGYYFAKNGVGVIAGITSAIRGSVTLKTKGK